MIVQVCTKCLMDTSDPDIAFDGDGVCQYCIEAEEKLPNYRFTKDQEKVNLKLLGERIKKNQSGEYDSILGLSGGVDSSYVAYLAKEMGLNPLCVHFDNGWNSDIAVKNIHKIIDKTGFDLYTYVINWPEFRDLQRSFFKASVIDIEMLTDHAIFASLFKLRRKHKIKTVLSGTNYATEHGLPVKWIWSKMDSCNIKAIHKKFGEIKLKTYPTMATFFWLVMRRFSVGGIFEEPLNIVSYNKTKVMDLLVEEFDWQYYGGKHYESVFTKFYQAYVLPTKFGVDKRKSHYSCLIRNGEMSKSEAEAGLLKPLYDENELIRDKAFVLKKLGFTESEFDAMISEPPVPHDYYLTDQRYIKPLIKIAKILFGKGKL